MKIIKFISALILSLSLCLTAYASSVFHNRLVSQLDNISSSVNQIQAQNHIAESEVSRGLQIDSMATMLEELTREDESLKQENADLEEQIKLFGGWFKRQGEGS